MDGTQTTYTITIHRVGNSNAFLQNMSVANLAISPSFDPLVYSYTVGSISNCPTALIPTCANNPPEFRLGVTYTAAHYGATMQVVYMAYKNGGGTYISQPSAGVNYVTNFGAPPPPNGVALLENQTAAVTSGVEYGVKALEHGATTGVHLTVTAQDGTNFKTYSFYVARGVSSVATLGKLGLNCRQIGSGPSNDKWEWVQPAFDPAFTGPYTVLTVASTPYLNVWPEVASCQQSVSPTVPCSLTSITIDGTPYPYWGSGWPQSRTPAQSR